MRGASERQARAAEGQAAQVERTERATCPVEIIYLAIFVGLGHRGALNPFCRPFMSGSDLVGSQPCQYPV